MRLGGLLHAPELRWAFPEGLPVVRAGAVEAGEDEDDGFMAGNIPL